ncbi:MAG: hypothetical protein KIT74_01410 [Fimbriimonadales bacterium]|nr:hypothetical protein [Fimbriimonadales bacterium]
MVDNRLLILSCSSRKVAAIGAVSAWELYDGVFFRVAKKTLGSRPPMGGLHIRILSAKYGLIEPESMIEYYDEKMSRELAQMHREYCINQLSRLCKRTKFDSALVVCGKAYVASLSPISEWAPANLAVELPPGGIGKKLQRLKGWLQELTTS